MATGRWIALAALLAAAGCKEKKERPAAAGGEQPAAATAASATAAAPAREPDLPDPVLLDCDRIVPPAVRAAHFPGFTLEKTIEGPIATCLFTDGAARPSVSLFCHRRKRNWDFTDEVARDRRKAAIPGVGRGAYSRNDHVFFYPSRLDCLGRVIWPGDPARGAAIAKALDPHLSRSTVQP